VIEAEDRKTALQLLGQRGLFPSNSRPPPRRHWSPNRKQKPNNHRNFVLARGSTARKSTAFTQEMGALLAAAIPIPQALDGLVKARKPGPQSGGAAAF